MQKKNVIPIGKTTIPVKCGECLHFKRNAKFEKPCSQLGIKHYANAPACYTPNAFELATIDPHIILQIGLMLKDFTGKQSRVLMMLLKQQTALEKNYDLKFGQPVYFCLGQDYLSNYFRGFVMGIAEAGDKQIFITSDMAVKKRKQSVIATLMPESVYTLSSFAKHKKHLAKMKKLNDPNPLYAPTPVTAKDVDTYVPPSMEHAPKEWFDKVKKPKAKSRITKSTVTGELTFKVERK